MLTADGCRRRRARLLARLAPAEPLLLADPLHLRYLAGFHVDPFTLSGDYGGLLLLRPDGHATLFHDDRQRAFAADAHADETVCVPWYAGQEPGRGPRRLAAWAGAGGGRVHDALGDPAAAEVIGAIAELRRSKDADELDVLRACMRATDAGHAWARANVRPGMTELDVYAGVASACTAAAGRAVIVYGDFVVSPGPARRVGQPTARTLAAGDTFILDYSVVIGGYRSDFTNTLCVGGEPSPEQRRLSAACMDALAAAEGVLRAGAACQAVYDAVRGSFAAAGLADHFPHHAGHGLGLAHPEPPFFVRRSTETLSAGDVVAVEPGLYVDGVGGMRFEHNYLVTADGFERLSGHEIGL